MKIALISMEIIPGRPDLNAVAMTERIRQFSLALGDDKKADHAIVPVYRQDSHTKLPRLH